MDVSLTPLFQQVMDSIKDDVDSGKYQTGDRIPSEDELSEMFSVSRITVRRAVSELVDRGYLTKVRGKGTFVNRPKLARKICQTSEIQSFTETCAEAGRVAGATVLGVEVVEARASEAEFLGVEQGSKLVHVKRVRTADGVPIMLERETGRRPTSDVKCTLEIAHASSKAAEDLKVSVGEPLFLETIHFLDQDGKPLMIGRQYIVGSLYIFNI